MSRGRHVTIHTVLTDLYLSMQAHKRLVAITFLVTLGLQGGAMVVAFQAWRAVFDRIGPLLEVAAREDHPTVADVLPLAVPIAVGVAQILAVTAVSLVLAFVIGSQLMTRSGLETQRMTGRRASSTAVAVLAALSLAFLVGALAMMDAPATTFHVRGSAITIVPPTISAVALLLGTFGATLVTSTLFLRVPSHTQAPTNERTAAPVAVGFSRAITAILGLTVASLAVMVVAHSVSAAPIADDYKFFARVREAGFLPFLGEFLTIETGRYAQASLIWLGYSLTGVDVVRWSPALTVVFIALGWAAALRVGVPGRRMAWPAAGLLGGLLSLALYASVPSTVDSYLWWSSTVVYMPPIGFGLFTFAAARKSLDATSARKRLGWRISALVLLFITQGFVESVTLMVLVASFVVIVLQWRRRPADRLFLLAIGAISLLGTAFHVFTPAQVTRMRATGGGNLLIGALGSLYSNLQLWQGLSLGSWFLLVGVALAASVLMRAHCTKAQLLSWGLAGGFVMVFPGAVTGFVSFYGLNWGPWRTYSVSAAFFSAGVGALVAAILALTLPMVFYVSRAAAASIALSCAAAVTLLAPGMIQLWQAETARSALIETRDQAVLEQFAEGKAVIDVMPAPLLAYPTDARDFEYAVVQTKDWFEPGYRRYFGLGNVTFRFSITPPPGYCTKDPRIARVPQQLCP